MTRCILFDRSGNIPGMARQEHRRIYPQPGWVEHDPVEIRDKTWAVIRASRAALEACACQTGDIVEAMGQDAGPAVVFRTGLEEIGANWAVDRTWTPELSAVDRGHCYRQWQKAVQRTFDRVNRAGRLHEDGKIHRAER